MRKVTAAMVGAIRARKAWAGGNTSVTPDNRQDGKPLALVALHGHHIATVGYDDKGAVLNVTVCLAGWNTVTTRDRLSAIVREFAYNSGYGLGVSTKQGEPRLHDARGTTRIDADGWHSVKLTALQE